MIGTARWTEHRLLIAIGLATAAFGIYEVTHPSEDSLISREHRALGALAEAYPNEPRLQYEVGLKHLNAGRLQEAEEAFEAAFDGGLKEQERFYAAYVDLLMITSRDRLRIHSIMERWRRDYPSTGRLARMEARLSEAGFGD